MLNKLLKYDLKNVYKLLVIFYILTLTFALITRLVSWINTSIITEIIFQICSGITISMMASCIINNLMRMWGRFVSNVYKDESYLTHTLPVTKTQIYMSKFLSAIITMFTSILVIFLSIIIAYYSKENMNILKSILLPLATVYQSTIVKMILAVIFILFLEMVTVLQAGFTGIIIGYRFNNNKIGYSVLFGFVAYMLGQLLVLAIVFLGALINSDIMLLFTTNTLPNVESIKIILYAATAVYAAYVLAYFILNKKLLNKGVNVD